MTADAEYLDSITYGYRLHVRLLRQVLRREDSSRTEPLALDVLGEVSTGNDVFRQVVECPIRSANNPLTEWDGHQDEPIWLGLVCQGSERLLPLQSVLELCKEKLSTVDEERARSVAVVSSIADFTGAHVSDQVVCQDGCLTGDGGGRLRCQA